MKDLKVLREESKGSTRLLWHHSYWDGPISGVMLWNGEQCWFEQDGDDIVTKIPFTDEERNSWTIACAKENYPVDEDDMFEYESYRIYNVYKLSPDVMEAIEYNHNLFREYVGTHTDYDENGNRNHYGVKSSKTHDLFYKNRSEHKVYELNKQEIIGVFKY